MHHCVDVYLFGACVCVQARPAIGVDSAPQIGLSGECAELIFKRAMSAGRAAAAAELEQVYGKSARLYLKGVLLLEFLLDSAHDETDKTVLNQCKVLMYFLFSSPLEFDLIFFFQLNKRQIIIRTTFVRY